MNETKQMINLSGRQIAVWLAALIGLLGSTALATAHYVFSAGALAVATLWVLRLVVLASFWLLPVKRDAKIFGIGLILLSLVLDLLLKLPVLGSVEYADWFLVSALDLSGAYGAYFIVWGLLLPLLTLTGWFVLVGRSWPGWVVGLALGAGLSIVLWLFSTSTAGTFTGFVLLSAARFIVPAALAALTDFLLRRRAVNR